MLEDEDDHNEVVEVVVYLVAGKGQEAKMLAQLVWTMLVPKMLLLKIVWAMEMQVGQCR